MLSPTHSPSSSISLFVSGVFPEKMKMAEIIPLFKDKEKDPVENYGPISLLMTLSKVLEKPMYKRMCGFLIANNIFFDSQYGFRSKSLCEHAILEILGHLLQAKNENKQHWSVSGFIQSI